MFVLSILLMVIVIICIIVSYKNREEDEEGLVWKLIGYLLLSLFIFKINGFPLPLGLGISYFLLKPEKNRNSKNNMRIIGIISYFINLFI